MGGLGSGGHNHSGKQAVEHCAWLDASALRRQGATQAGWIGRICWPGTETHDNTVDIHGGHDAIRLSYAWRRGEGDWVPMREAIDLAWVLRQWGGEEVYFRCPQCDRRSKRLYFRGHAFRCRPCHRLVHASSREQTADRATRKMRKLRRRMGSPEGLEQVILRPKGMHKTTFDRMVGKIIAAENEVWDDGLRLLGRLKRIEERIDRQIGNRDFWA